MDKKLTNIAYAAFIIVMGILVAVCGAGTAVDVYFGIVSIVAGVIMLAFAFVAVAKKLPMPVGFTILGAILVTIAIALFVQKITFAELLNILAWSILGLGAGLVIVGLYSLIKVSPAVGAIQLTLGVACIVLTTLYLGISEFRTAFWIIAGIVIAAYGVFSLIVALMNKPAKSRK